MNNIFTKIFFGVLIFHNVSFAKPIQCLFGDPDNKALINQLESAKIKSPVTQAIYKSLEIEGVSPDEAICKAPSAVSMLLDEKNLKHIVQVVQNPIQSKRMIYNSECLRKSVAFTVDSSEVSCPGGKKTKNLCITDEFLDYQNAVISNFYSCLKELDISTISPGALLSIYSLESGFKPFYASKRGVGMGQLTSDFVADVHQPWRGGEYLEKIAKSNSKTCRAAKLIAEQDMKKTPSLKNFCLFIQAGDGFERNILYTLIGAATGWNKDLLPKMGKYVQRYSSFSGFDRVKDVLLTAAHGPGGNSSAINILGKISNLSPDEILYPKQSRDPITALDPYLKNLKTRQRQVIEELPTALKPEDETTGLYSCVNN